LTLIFELGDEFYIESHVVNRATISAGSFALTTITNDKPGKYLGGAAFLDINSTDEADLAGINYAILKSDNGQLAINDDIATIRVRRYNNTAGDLSFGLTVILFMRRPAR